MVMRTGKSHCFISYNKLGPFTKLATSYKEERPNLFMVLVLEKEMEESCRTMRGGFELMTREVRPASFNPDQVQGP